MSTVTDPADVTLHGILCTVLQPQDTDNENINRNNFYRGKCMQKFSRSGDSAPSIQLRSDRFYKLHHFWFFQTREGVSVGPFDSREVAESGAMEYIKFVQSATAEAMNMLSGRASAA